MTARVALWFNGDVSPELIQFSLRHPLLPKERICSRGKTGGAHKEHGSFQWTPAVQSLALFFLRSVTESQSSPVALRGFYGSPATSLDFAINKQPAWLLDMFGLTADGTCLVHRIISRTNPGSKRPGPVELSLNTRVLCSDHIEIYINGCLTEKIDELRSILASIESAFAKSAGKRSKPRGREDFDKKGNPPHFLPLDIESVTRFLHPTHLSELRGRILFHSNQPEATLEPLGEHGKARLLGVFDREVQSSYRNASGLQVGQFQSTISRFAQDESCRRYFGAIPANFCDFASRLRGYEDLGIPDSHVEMYRALASDTPLEFAVCGTNVSAVCLLYFLKYVRGFNIRLNSGANGHGQDLLSGVLEGAGTIVPDGVIMGIAQSIALLRSPHNPGFRHLMEFPQAPHRVVSPKTRSSSVLSRGRFVVYQDTPVYLHHAQAEGRFKQNEMKIETGDHNKIVAALWEGDPEMRALVWFPHYTLYELLNTHDVSSVPAASARPDKAQRDSLSGFLASTVCLSVHKTVFEKGKARFLEIAIRDAWISLIENPTLRRFLIRLIVEDFQLLKVLFRGSGLHRRGMTDEERPKARSTKLEVGDMRVCSNG